MSYNILHIQSSPLGDKSVSRKLGKKVVGELKSQHPDHEVIERDLVVEPFPHIDGLTINAFYTPPDQRDLALNEAAALSEAAVEEVMNADAIVIEAPMYNFSIPSTLKTWIDHVVRNQRTFKYDESGPKGLVPSGKRVFIVSARGGVYSDGPMKAMDFQEPYLRTVLGFIGLTDVTFVRSEGGHVVEEPVNEVVEGSLALAA